MKQPELIIEDMIPQGRKVDADKKELRALADDIHTNGLKHPILVVEGIVVDGLKRIEAFKLLGRARIPALVTNNFGEACYHLEKAREGTRVETPRLVEIVEDLAALRREYNRLRYLPRLKKENDAKPWGRFQPRIMMARALGWSNSYSEGLHILVTNAVTNPELARRLALVKQGKDTVHGTYKAWRHRMSLEEGTAKPEDIRTTITRGIQTMETTLAAMIKHGSMLSLPGDEREEYVKQLGKIRRELYTVTKYIREGLNMEAKEGQEG